MFFFAQLLSAKLFLAANDERNFLNWMLTNNVFYHGDDYFLRLGIYLANARYVHEFNSKGHGYTLSLYQFATYTSSEYASLLNVPSGRMSSHHSHHERIQYKDTPTSFDWRSEGKVNPIKNQGSCGSCWAFSAIAAQESCHAIATGELLRFSEQSLVDCVTSDYSCQGCSGGWPDQAMKYVIEQQNGKFILEENYQYSGHKGACLYDEKSKVSNIVAVTMFPQSDEQNLKGHIAANGPVSCNVDAGHYSFQLYQGGIYWSWFCRTQYIYNHAMGIVGYGVEGSEEYWIVRNSWGESWGEQGYIRYLLGSNVCNIADYVTYPTYQ